MHNPVFQNPGNAGQFEGDWRFVGNFREQWRAVSVPFQTFSISADSKLYEHRNFGFGGIFFHDQSGDGRLKTIEFQANASYVFKITADSMHTLRPGVNIGLNHRQVNWSSLHFGNQFNGFYYDPSLPNNETYDRNKKTNISMGMGAVYKYRIDNREFLEGGLAFFNINRPNQGFYNEKIPRAMRTTLFANAQRPLDLDWDIIPHMQLSFQRSYTEIMLGANLKYTLTNRLADYKALYAGISHRWKDAFFISMGMDYQQWFVGLSYDINVSTLRPASHIRGGFEIAVRYILVRFVPKKNFHRICPDYI